MYCLEAVRLMTIFVHCTTILIFRIFSDRKSPIANIQSNYVYTNYRELARCTWYGCIIDFYCVIYGCMCMCVWLCVYKKPSDSKIRYLVELRVTVTTCVIYHGSTCTSTLMYSYELPRTTQYTSKWFESLSLGNSGKYKFTSILYTHTCITSFMITTSIIII